MPLNSTLGANLTTHNEYRVRSSMSSGLSYGLFTAGDTPQPRTDYGHFPFAEIKQSVEQYRSVQKYFYGDYYPLTEYSLASDTWVAYQLDLPEQGEGMIVIVKRPASDYREATFPLQALRQDSRYEITNLDSGEKKTFTGKELTEKGLEARLEGKPDSALLCYRRQST